MADLAITAANVKSTSDAVTEQGTAGEAITQGKAVYKSGSTSKWMLADNDSGTLEARIASGIALNSASADQPLTVHKSGDITIGATLTAGDPYYVSSTPGGICPKADLSAGKAVCMLGLAISTTVLRVDIQNPGVVL